MPKVNVYTDISEIDKEAKKDYIDRHSPFVSCADTAKKGELFEVTVQMGQEYTHPDDFDHYIESITLFDGETKLAHTSFVPGTFGNEKSHAKVTFYIRPMKSKLKLSAMAYCTKHGVWQGPEVTVKVTE